jgi:hypothetical protein
MTPLLLLASPLLLFVTDVPCMSAVAIVPLEANTPAVDSVSAVLLVRYVPGMPAIVDVPVVGNIHAIASVSSAVVFQ